MSYFDSHTIGIFENELLTVQEFIKVAINTIMFNRWIINNNYICQSSAINNISYMKIEDDKLEKSIKDILDDISRLSKSNQRVQIDLDFYTQSQGFFSVFFQSKAYWEKWNILVIITDKGSQNKESYMRKFITKILNELNTDKDYMPDIKLENFEDIAENKNDKNKDFKFPYDVKVNTGFDYNVFRNFSPVK